VICFNAAELDFKRVNKYGKWINGGSDKAWTFRFMQRTWNLTYLSGFLHSRHDGGMRLFWLAALLLLFAFPCLASVAITTTTLPNGEVDAPFSAVVNASGGCTPYHWALVSGSLPTGISMTVSSNTESLDLKGTPTVGGTDSFTVSVTGCGGHVSKMSYEVVIQTTPTYVIDLSWNASTSSDISGYNIHRAVYSNSTCGPFSKINSSLNGSTVYSDSLVVDGTSYCYATTTVNSSNEESAYSNIVSGVQVPAP